MKNVVRATCSECGETADRTISSGSKDCDQAFAEKMFRNIRWRLGSDRTKDCCPACVAKAKQMAALEAKHKKELAIENGVELPSPAVIANPDQDALISIIAEHIHEVDGYKVYKAGFSDRIISETLGVAQWRITDLRQKHIGLGKPKAPRKNATGVHPENTSGNTSANSDLEKRLENAEQRVLELQALVETTSSSYQSKLDQSLKLTAQLTAAMAQFKSRLDELSLEFDEFSEPLSLSPRTILQLFKGQARTQRQNEARAKQQRHMA